MARIRNKQIFVSTTFNFENQGLDNLLFIQSANSGADALPISAPSVDMSAALTVASTATIGTGLTVTTGDAVVASGNLSVNGNATITGDLTVQGSLTSLETTNTQVKDKNITLNAGGPAASLDGAGIDFEEDGAITQFIRYTSADDAFNFSTGIVLGQTDPVAGEPAILKFQDGVDTTATTISSFTNSTATILPEGSDYTVADGTLVTKGYVDKVVNESADNQFITVNGDNSTTDNLDFGKNETLDFVGTDGIVIEVTGDANVNTVVTASLDASALANNFKEETSTVAVASLSTGTHTVSAPGIVGKSGTAVFLNGVKLEAVEFGVGTDSITVTEAAGTAANGETPLGFAFEDGDVVTVTYIAVA